jgi:hypothetical protein
MRKLDIIMFRGEKDNRHEFLGMMETVRGSHGK